MTLKDHADGLKFLIRDRHTKLSTTFDAVFASVSKANHQDPCPGAEENAIAERRPA